MERAVEALSPTRKKISVTMTTEEVNAAITHELNEYRKNLVLPGFRRGKVPVSILEHRFGAEIRGRATNDAINTMSQQAIKESGLNPVSQVQIDHQDQAILLEKDKPLSYTFQFDVLPEIAFPEYEGMEVEEHIAGVEEKEIEAIVDELRERQATDVEVQEDRLPQDGDVVDVDYAGFDPENPQTPVPDVKGEGFTVVLGRKQAIDDFEALVKTAKRGEEKEGIVAFPEGYGHPDLAGKKVLFKITVKSLRERHLPPADDEFAKKTNHDDMAKLRAGIEEQLKLEKKQEARMASVATLRDRLLAQVSFELPQAMLEHRIDRILEDRDIRLSYMGKSLKDLGKSIEELRAEVKEEAEKTLRPQVFLMALAEKEKLVVTEQEMQSALFRIAMNAKQDYEKVENAYRRTGMIVDLRNRLTADKAMFLIYTKAKIHRTGPGAPEENPETKDTVENAGTDTVAQAESEKTAE